jgi:hypothetical protein
MALGVARVSARVWKGGAVHEAAAGVRGAGIKSFPMLSEAEVRSEGLGDWKQTAPRRWWEIWGRAPRGMAMPNMSLELSPAEADETEGAVRLGQDRTIRSAAQLNITVVQFQGSNLARGEWELCTSPLNRRRL